MQAISGSSQSRAWTSLFPHLADKRFILILRLMLPANPMDMSVLQLYTTGIRTPITRVKAPGTFFHHLVRPIRSDTTSHCPKSTVTRRSPSTGLNPSWIMRSLCGPMDQKIISSSSKINSSRWVVLEVDMRVWTPCPCHCPSESLPPFFSA